MSLRLLVMLCAIGGGVDVSPTRVECARNLVPAPGLVADRRENEILVCPDDRLELDAAMFDTEVETDTEDEAAVTAFCLTGLPATGPQSSAASATRNPFLSNPLLAGRTPLRC